MNINEKLLSIVALISIIASVIITFLFLNNNQNTLVHDKDVLVTQTQVQHPYNECIKLFIEKTKEPKEFDFEKVKSICFELLNKDK